MAISFACPSCGKILKAPDSAVGKSSNCPGCGSRVTCPEPVYEAEIVAPAHVAGAFDDLDDATPYGMTAEPTTAPAAGSEARRPCPMCGEMIVVGAAKCRFCGEVFDAVVKKTGKKTGKKAKLRAVASHQRNLLICIVLQIVFNIAAFAVNKNLADTPQPSPAMGLLALFVGLGLLAAAIGGLVYACLLASKFYGVGVVILLAVLSLVPCLGLIILLMINQRATAMLQENGYEVGLLGAKMS
ncbi:MAG: hypothetical protein ACYC61_22025 [Isosphaeraceae bacterium]